jgi:RNA polymerase sigma-70 factor (ECF subfamily)
MDPPLFENQVVVQGKNFSPEEIETILTKALATLPEKQLMVFNLRYFDELKFSEITELTGTTEGGLKASYHIAVKKIEDFINGI